MPEGALTPTGLALWRVALDSFTCLRGLRAAEVARGQSLGATPQSARRLEAAMRLWLARRQRRLSLAQLGQPGRRNGLRCGWAGGQPLCQTVVERAATAARNGQAPNPIVKCLRELGLRGSTHAIAFALWASTKHWRSCCADNRTPTSDLTAFAICFKQKASGCASPEAITSSREQA